MGTNRALVSRRQGPRGWVQARAERLAATLGEMSGRFVGPAAIGGGTLRRTGSLVARWLSFPRGVKAATAVLTLGGAGALVALAAGDAVLTGAALAGAAWLVGASAPIGTALARRLQRVFVEKRRYQIAELRTLPDRMGVAVRGVVVARRTAASALDGRAAVWSLARFDTWSAVGVFHEAAFDFLLDDGTDEPILVEVAGGMLLNGLPAGRRVEFRSTTLLDIDHPFLTRLRLGGKEIHAAEIAIAAGDVVEVVGRLSRTVDPSAPADSGRAPPERRSLRSGTRVPLMVRRVSEPDVALARVRRLAGRAADESPGEPPVRKF